MTRLLAAVAALALGAIAAGAQTPDAERLALRGATLDQAGRPIAGAQVQHVESGERATTGADGRFRLGRVPDGTHTLELRAVGYRPRTLRLVVGPDRAEQLEIELVAAAAQPLDSVRVTAAAPARYAPGALREFEQRLRDRPTGWQFDTTAIMRWRPVWTSDVLRTVSGIAVVGEGPRARLMSTRGITTLPAAASGAVPPGVVRQRPSGPPAGQMNKGPGFGACVAVYLNGIRTNGEINQVPPGALHGIEVYRAVDAPVQYTGFDTCAVVLLWTR